MTLTHKELKALAEQLKNIRHKKAVKFDSKQEFGTYSEGYYDALQDLANSIINNNADKF